MRFFLLTVFSLVNVVSFAGPLDDANGLYRAAPYDPQVTVISNEGTEGPSAQFELGSTLVADNNDPIYWEDASGKYLRYSAPSMGTINLPASVLNGDVTIGIRYRSNQQWTQQLLLSIIDDNGSTVTKHFMLTRASHNKFLSRFWGNETTRPQISAESLTSSSTSVIHSVFVVWDSTAQENRIYIDGNLEAVGTVGTPRSEALEDGLEVPRTGLTTSLTPGHDVFAIAVFDKVKSATDIAAITNNPIWKNETAPPPPPPPGDLILNFNGVQHVNPILFLIDGQPLTVDGPNDKIVDIITE